MGHSHNRAAWVAASRACGRSRPSAYVVTMLFLSASPDSTTMTQARFTRSGPSGYRGAEGIQEAGLGDAVVRLPPRLATREELETVHTAAYLHMIEDFCAAGGGPLDPDTVVSQGSWVTALLAVGGALAALEALSVAGEGTAFVAHRPPGHHATADQGDGFLPPQQGGDLRRQAGRARRAGAGAGLGRTPRQRHGRHFLGRPACCFTSRPTSRPCTRAPVMPGPPEGPMPSG